MSVFTLFEDGTASELTLELYCQDNPPIEARVTNQDNQQIKASVNNGTKSAYYILGNKEVLEKDERYFADFGFSGGSLAYNALGESAGLAFSLKFYDEVFKSKKGKGISFSVAATGRISDHTGDAKVEGVEGINKKLAAAANVLKERDRILYPEENEEEIDEKVKKELEAKGIKTVPVSTVKEAIDSLEVTPLFDWQKDPPPPSPAKYSLTKMIIRAFLFLGALALIWYFGYRKERPPPDFRTLNFYYFTTHPGKVDLKKVSHLDVALRSGDGYQLEIEPEDDCYLYIYQIDSTGNLASLFPRPEDIRARNPLKAGATYWLPSKEKWYYLDENIGEEIIYLLASHGHLELFKEGVAIPELIEKIKSQNVKGSFYREFKFRHRD